MAIEHYRPSRFSLLPVMVKNLLIINGLFFLATITFSNVFHIDLSDYLGLHFFQSKLFQPWQYLTYMFMHASIDHIIFNMLALWMFGYALENYWGGKKFLFYYLVTGIGAAFVQSLVIYITINQYRAQLDPEQISEIMTNGLKYLKNNQNYLGLAGEFNLALNSVTVGASGAVFGILLAFGMMFPNQLVYIYFLFPIKAKWFVIIYGIAELIFGVTNTHSNVAHFAHLGGMLFGYFLIKMWKKNQFQNHF